MPWNLEIEVGGLAVIVQRDDGDPLTRGLFVLMPRMKEPGMEHVAMALYTAHGTKHTVDLGRVVVSWRDLVPHGPATDQLPPELAPISDFSGHRVATRWLEQRPDDCLEARVELPLGCDVRPVGKRARFRVGNPSAGPQQTFVGRAKILVSGIDDARTSIPLGDHTVDRDPRQADVRIRIVNARPGDIDCPKQAAHQQGDVSIHFPALYWLLADWCDGRRHEPSLYIDENVAADDDCQDESRFHRLDGRERYIDPYYCVIGTASV